MVTREICVWCRVVLGVKQADSEMSDESNISISCSHRCL